MQRVFITGANRGIGLALTQQYLERGAKVFATCREPQNATALRQLADETGEQIEIIALDVTDATAIAASADRVAQQVDGLDVLINNAGIFPRTGASQTFGQLEHDAMTDVLYVNAVSPVIVTQALVGLLRRGENPRVMMVSSGMGSIGRLGSAGSYSYRMSKAAMNMAARLLSFELAPDVTTVTVHPGSVKTDMGGSGSAITPEESASALITMLDGLTPADNGKYFNYTGDPLPW